MKDFRTLVVWQKSHALTLAVYRGTRDFPKSEVYGLTSQIRRSSSSIPCNIAEGCGRGSPAEFGRFLQIAMGSASELEYQLLLVHDLSYLSAADYQCLHQAVTEVKRMLAALIKTVNG